MSVDNEAPIALGRDEGDRVRVRDPAASDSLTTAGFYTFDKFERLVSMASSQSGATWLAAALAARPNGREELLEPVEVAPRAAPNEALEACRTDADNETSASVKWWRRGESNP
ncbi:MAG: hypothetical protein U0Q11_17210 [Vicinamibacterales bacterium]